MNWRFLPISVKSQVRRAAGTHTQQLPHQRACRHLRRLSLNQDTTFPAGILQARVCTQH